MKKNKKQVLFFSLMVSLLLISSSVLALAAEIMPLYDNIIYANSRASISDSGILTVSNEYMGKKEP